MKLGPKREGMIFRALPDSGRCGIRLNSSGKPELVMPNQIAFSPSVDAVLNKEFEPQWFGDKSETLDPKARRIVNLCADAGEYAKSLVFLDDALPPDVPVFNHPRAVMASRRDIAGQGLTGIPGLQIPACRRFRADNLRAFSRCFEEGNFTYPVTVQLVSEHGGAGRIRIEHPLDWQRAFNSNWGGHVHVMVQATPEETDGSWMVRMVFVGKSGTMEPWRAKPLNAGAAPSATPIGLPFQASQPALSAIFNTACARLPLDLWTLDLIQINATTFRLVDLAPGLPVSDNAGGPDILRDLSLNLLQDLSGQMAALLMAPQLWRSDARLLPSVSAQQVRFGT